MQIVQASNLPSDIMQSGKFLSLESESPEFLEEYTHVIDSDEVKHAEETIDVWIGL